MAESTHHGVPLTDQAARRVKELAGELGGVYVIAYDRPVIPAHLTPDQVTELQRAEQELGVSLVAYRKHAEDRWREERAA